MKPFIISIAVHVLLISFTWVGFSVSRGTEQKAFIYLGEKADGGSVYRASSMQVPVQVSDMRALGKDQSRSWLKMRALDKPR